ncbi:DMT family transporter [Salipiger mucosus]|uniref:Permease of the drug/metabolite transporter (DMT) superfamily n=1 Tax=Salipiger mucosus DSM 16094 TaxID=1123237 RepID=S9QDT1_9RHOB|nr:DMT family transporter [Salipiger mucosus]EPX79576.1 Permease of the drug/metabolite transporter (DMT) superfamily [Salipiger mucosus DSM 16094]
MRLFLLTALTMMAFAANSVLNRAALAGGGIGPEAFGTIRLLSGAGVLLVLALVLRRRETVAGPGRIPGVAGLLLYIYGFSAAYVALDAGAGALILFGVVQVTMFAGALLGGERPPARRWIGAVLAFAGLSWLLWPGADAVVSLRHGLTMAAAGLGWGVYSLAGRKARDPLFSTAANFVLAAPLGLFIGAVVVPSPSDIVMTGAGIVLAVVSGAVTSGLGYALWYSVLPQLPGTVAAVAQLTVPVIAALGGVIVLGEGVSPALLAAAGLVLGGVAISVLPLPRWRPRG